MYDREGVCDCVSQSGSTALMRAAAHDYAVCVRLLVEAGADKEAKDRVRVSPLFIRSLSRLIGFMIFLRICTRSPSCDSVISSLMI